MEFILNQKIRIGELMICPSEQEVHYSEKEILFTNREFQILYLLARYQGHVFSKRQIYSFITDGEEKDCYHTIEITISRIRKKLKECTGRKDFIVTINGRGYKFKK